MALIMTKSVSMQLKLANGFNENGSAKYVTRSISDINPALGNDDFYAAAEAVSSLLANECCAVHRVENNELAK